MLTIFQKRGLHFKIILDNISKRENMLDPRSSMSGYGRFLHLRLRQCQRLTQRLHSGAIVERESGGILYTCVCVTIDVDERCELGFIVTTEEQQEQRTKQPLNS